MKRVLLTGASAGIGRAVAELLVAEGCEVWGTSRDLSRLNAASGFHPVEMDLSRPESIASGFQKAIAEARDFDILINNAGNGIFGPVEHLPMEQVRRKFEVLVFGHIDLIQRVLPSMRLRGDGLIINVTSLAAQLPIPLMAPYNAAKAAMSAFSASLNLELTGTGVRVVELQPGDIHTEFNASVFKGGDSGYEALARRAWMAVEHEIAVAPPPEIVARAVLRLIRRPMPLATVGGFFQAVVASRVARLAPRSWLLWGIRKYFGL